MTARMVTESSAAREVILESLPVLRGRLAEQGFDIAQFQVDVAENQGDAAFGGQNGQEFQRDGRGDSSALPADYRRATHLRRQLDAAVEAPTPLARALQWQVTTDSIDVQA